MGQVPPARVLGRLPVVAWTENKVEILRNGAKSWDPASTNTSYNRLNPGDQLRTLENSRAGRSTPAFQMIRWLFPGARPAPSAPEKLAAPAV